MAKKEPDFGKRLRKLREERGLSLAELGELTGVGKIPIARFEWGTFEPRLNTLRKLARALEVTLDELVGFEL
jgi:transcriptional regulator with XRE-family HTH domain